MSDDKIRLDRSVTEFMQHIPVYLSPILYRAEYRDRQLPESEVMALMTLAYQGPLSPTSISRQLNMQKGSLTSVLKRLEKLGLIARRANPSDDRSHVVELSAQGADLTRAFGQLRRQEIKNLFEAMAPGDKFAAAKGLDLISQHFRKLEEKKMAQAQDSFTKSLNWYQAASPEDRKEYDSFGPWLTEIKSEDDMPRRFRSLYADHADAKYLIKVPKNADRRQLRPGMDLFEALIAVGEEGIFLARLHESGVWTQQSNWDDIAAVCSYGDRLQGIWTLHLRDGNRPNLTYNKVSTDLMDEVTDYVRNHLMQHQEQVTEPDAQNGIDIDFSDEDLFFGSSLLELRRREGGPFTPIHFEPQGQPCIDEDGKRGVSTGVLILDSPNELIIVNRGDPSHRRGEAWYVANDLFIPYSRITDCSVLAAPMSGAAHFQTFVLRMDGQVIEQPCLQDPARVLATIKLRCPNLK